MFWYKISTSFDILITSGKVLPVPYVTLQEERIRFCCTRYNAQDILSSRVQPSLLFVFSDGENAALLQDALILTAITSVCLIFREIPLSEIVGRSKYGGHALNGVDRRRIPTFAVPFH